MSKTYDNTIEIFCSKEDLTKKIMSFKTDSASPESAKSVTDNNLYALYSAFLDTKAQAALKRRFETPPLRYSDVKRELVELIWNYFSPYRKLRDKFVQNPDRVVKILDEGAKKARRVAAKTIKDVRKKTGVDYR